MKWKLDILEPMAKYSKIAFEFDDFEEMTEVMQALATACVDKVSFEVSAKKGEDE